MQQLFEKKKLEQAIGGKGGLYCNVGLMLYQKIINQINQTQRNKQKCLVSNTIPQRLAVFEK